MRRAAFTAAVVLGLGAAACASILGIEDGKLDPSAGDSGIELCTADGGVQPNPGQLFVSVEVGVDSASCGSQSAPCKTIKAALDALNTSTGVHTIYLATSRHPEATYAESVDLPSNIELQGGWGITGSPQAGYVWQQICESELNNQQQIANIVGTGSVAVRASNGAVALTNLFVGTRAPNPGESMVGLYATGEGTTVTLTNVTISAAKGGDGKDGDQGAPGDDGSDAGCEAGSAMTPEAGAGGQGANAPTYGADGVHAGSDSTAGGPGGDGTNGPPSPDAGCIPVATGCLLGPLSCNDNQGTQCGSPGVPGCGAKGGMAGGPGQSGGTSVGIYVSGGAHVVTIAGTVSANGGGKGGNGGLGGSGGSGATGAKGADSAKVTSTCKTCSTPQAAVGWPGTKGGDGSNGGQGGGGAGGDSYAVVNLDASFEGDATLNAASGGSQGDPNGVSGKSGALGAP